MESLTEKIDALFAQNKGAEAEKLMLQALQELEVKAQGEECVSARMDMVPILNELTGYCRETGQAERSYEYAQRAIGLLEQMGLGESIPYATTVLNAANAYRAGGRLEDSWEHYIKVAEIYKEQLEPKDMLWANFYNNLSLLYQELKRYDWAKESLLKALGIALQNPDTIFEQAVTYTNLANSCLELEQEEEAQKYFTGAILLFEKYNIKDSHYCAALSAMGNYFYRKKEYARALKYFKKAGQGIEESLGRNEYYYRMQENARLCEERLEEENARLCRDRMEETEAAPQLPKKGMELCREYYETCGKPMLMKEFPQYVHRIAVGLMGEGSDCFGYDDGFSMDHDWGPRFMMWVSREVYEEIGEKLEEAYQGLPVEFQGYAYKESRQAHKRQGVFVIQDYFEDLLGIDSLDNISWENIEMYRLAAATNGKIFTDPEGTVTDIRKALKENYPRHLVYTKIAEHAARFSQCGQYNYARMKKRGDLVAAGIMLSQALKEVMQLLYLVDGEYPPHDKWLYRGLLAVEEYGRIMDRIEVLASCAEEEREKHIEVIAEEVALLLYQRNYISDIETYLEAHVGELLFKAGASELSVEELAEKIAGLEFEAFDKVKNYGGRADCQDDWFTFSIMRKSQYLLWSKDMLLQYYYDFTREYRKGHNLIEEKYGRMMESTAPEEYAKISASFPAISDKKRQIIEGIVRMQVAWMEEFAEKYPHLAGNARSIHTYEDHLFNTSYETYLRGEISTYSDKMLELYGRFVVDCAKSGGNLAKKTMEQSVLMYGYEGLEEAERLVH